MKTLSTIVRPPGVRIQLTLWYFLVFALLLLISDIIFYEQLQTSLYNNLTETLQLRAQQIAAGISLDNGKLDITDVTGDLLGADNGPNVNNNSTANNVNNQQVDLEPDSLIRVLDAKGKTVLVTMNFRKLPIPSVSITQALHGTAWEGTVVAHNKQQIRIYSMAVMDNNTPYAIVQVGESLKQLDSTLDHIILEFLLIAPIVLLFGALGSYWLAKRAFIPVDHLTRAAQQIKAGDLHQRVPVPRSHDEVQRLALTLNEMIERLDQSFTRQRRFVADASHELRTPVAVIRSMTDLAQLQHLSPQDYDKVLQDINAETERLGHLISDLLALARADEGQANLEHEPVRLDLLAHAVVANAEPLALEHHVTVHVDAPNPVTVIGDEARLIQATINLLDNAIIYNKAEGQVTLSVAAKGQQAYLTVSDTGIGIAPEHIPHLFERFYRVDSARTRTEGNSSGLGLAIVDWVVRAHNGSISVESQPGKGSTFTVTLPLALRTPAAPITPMQLKADGKALSHR